ncbi:ESX secretion-associated protein EspG [Nocardia brasiliensis]|uniref:ESX secretion-associated protein EspG n=1 Tax=Nocardia brasiliensis TaxID=37326 RepID=UPI0024564839|nr:ESX secretion-associated protein EspG [Nocardia brasiliensis]
MPDAECDRLKSVSNFGAGVNSDPVAIDLNVDAALLLKDIVGIDSYPPVLALLPNIFRLEDRDRVHAAVAAELTELGIMRDGRVHREVERWLWCLYRPDVELAARVVGTGLDGDASAMLRLSLVRRGERHVLAARCDDAIVIQPVFHEQGRSDTVAAAVAAALGPCPPVRFTPMTATLEQFTDVPADPVERRQALIELGARPQTATVLTRALDQITRRAEIVLIEHQDGSTVETEVCLSVLDTREGRIVVTPAIAMDGEVRSTYAPGDDTALAAGIAALIELLPCRSWFRASRIR